MSAGEKADGYVARVVEEFRSDPEVCREIEEEIHSHIQAASDDFIAEGEGEEAALQKALDSLGPAEDWRGELVEANAKRLKIRALALFGLRRLFVPAVVVFALFAAANEWVKYSYQLQSLATLDGSNSISLFDKTIRWMKGVGFGSDTFSEISDADRRLLYGDPKLKTELGKAKTRWQENPDNKGYYSIYLQHALNGKTGLPENFVETGERIDPGNAFYSILAATPDKVSESFVLTDEQFENFKRASEMEFYDSNKQLYAEEQMSLLPELSGFADRVERLSWLAGQIFPSGIKMIDLGKAVAARAEMHAAKKDRAALEELEKDWIKLSKVLSNKRVHFLIENIVIEVFLEKGAEGFSNAWEELGEPQNAEIWAKRKEDLKSYKVKNEAKQGKKADFTRSMEKSSSLVSIALPAFFGFDVEPPSVEDFKASRMEEWIVAETLLIAAYMIVCSVFIVIISFVGWRLSRLVRKTTKRPLMFLSLKGYLVVPLLSLLISGLIYLICSRIWPNALTDYGLQNGIAVSATVLLGVALITFGVLMVGVRFVVIHACQQAGIPVNFDISKIPSLLLGAITVLCMLAFLFRAFSVVSLVVVLILGLLFVGWVSFPLLKGLFRESEYSAALLTLARQSTIVTAIHVLLIWMIIPIVLHPRETHWAQADKLFQVQNGSFSKIESEASEYLMNHIHTTVAKWD